MATVLGSADLIQPLNYHWQNQCLEFYYSYSKYSEQGLGFPSQACLNDEKLNLKKTWQIKRENYLPVNLFESIQRKVTDKCPINGGSDFYYFKIGDREIGNAKICIHLL